MGLREYPPALSPDNEANYASQTSDARRLKAWKYYGYPAYARHLGSSHDCMVLRRFSQTQARCLLSLQHDIAVLERRLHDWDAYGMKDPSENLSCCSLDYDPVPERRGILAELTRTLSEYNSLLSSFASLRALPRATARDVTNLKNWHATYAHAIDDSERHDLGHEDGLFQLIPLQQSMFAVTLQHIPVLRSIFRTRRRSDHDEDGVAEYWSDTAMDSAATLLTLIAGLGMLLGSCWWLEHIDNEASRLDLITGSTTLFALGLWGAMGNKSAEVLTGTAGYMAILVIYLSH